jgi:outer membrane protein TolC
MRTLLPLFCLLTLLVGWQGAWSQVPLSLDSAVQRAYQHAELQRQVEITQAVTESNVGRIGKTYLPTLDLNAVSTYQNEQISIPVTIPVPGFVPPTAPLNLNNALLTIRQWIYDGSQSHHSRMIEEAAGASSLLEIETQRQQIKTTVMQHFFAVLLAEKHQQILTKKQAVLQQRFKEVASAVRNHVLLQTDADLLQAEIVQLSQAMVETQFTRLQHLRALEQLMGSPLPESVELIRPSVVLDRTSSVTGRPDMLLLDSRMNELEARKNAVSTTYLPKIGLFADVGLGLPGYDIFDDSPAMMARAGLTLSWHLFDWDKGGAQEESLELTRQLLTLQKQQLITQVSVQTNAQLTELERAESMLASDQELVKLYASISTTYAVQLQNGTITSAEYITQLNKEESAQTNLELHKLQALVATMNYNTMLGR